MRTANIQRNTKETDIQIFINLDGNKASKINTGIGFFNHMLELLAFHAKIDLQIVCKGDLIVDQHHSIEDVAIALGAGMKQALGEKIGIQRYASFYLPMDESLTRTNLDLSGRFTHVFCGEFQNQQVGELPTQMVEHFFYTLANQAAFTLHQTILYGKNDHHKIESLFKGFAYCLKAAIFIKGDVIPSSKGVL